MTKGFRNKKIAVLGSGVMGEALIAGVLANRQVDPTMVFATDVALDRTRTLQQRFGIRVGQDNAEAVVFADIVILAVKPHMIPNVLADVYSAVNASVLVLSIAAGVTLEYLGSRLPAGTKVVRVMPNLPVLVGEGMSALAAGPGVGDEDMEIAGELFQSVGSTMIVDESMMDVVTGLSGSGPAYILLAIEALADGGVKMGLPREMAMTLAVQTTRGAVRLLEKTGDHPARLKDRIASPGGTTIAALHTLEAGGFRSVLMSAVEAATKRSKELGVK